MQWLEVFKKQNQAVIILSGFLAVTGTGMMVVSSSGTKYDVIEYCFKPRSSKKFCTDDKKYITPKGMYQQEKYMPANPQYQGDELFIISDKLTRLRDIPASNPYAINQGIGGLVIFVFTTFLIKARAKRYKREFSVFYEELKTDLNSTIGLGEQQRELVAHRLGIETSYIKDQLQLQDEIQRYQDMSPGQREFEALQVEKNNVLAEYQREIAIAQFKLELAKIESEIAKYKNLGTAPKTIETVKADEVKIEELCPGKVGDLDYYDWRDLIDDAVGIIIAGNSGSGKTSVAVWVAGWLTKDEPAEVIALDPHANVNVLWKELGIHTISEFSQIEKQLGLLINLLDERRGMGLDELNMQPQVIVFADEINACLSNFEDKASMANAIKRLGSEARKYRIALIALNQSSNVEDLGISAPMRSNYLLVLLNASARQFARNNWKQDDPRHKYVEETAYSCVVAGSVAPSVAIHPTHYSYTQFKKKGNKPLGLLPINQLPLTIELAEEEVEETDWYETFIAMKKQLGRVPNCEEIKLKWNEMMGGECSSKQAETIHEYLKGM
jgi:hypothetical protein